MARKRMIDPAIWASEDFAKLSILGRVLWIGLFSNADDEGRGKANLSYLKSKIFAFDDDISTKKIENELKKIQNVMQIEIYEVDGKSYYQLLNWKKYQTINRPTPSEIPSVSQKQEKKPQTNQTQITDNSLNDSGAVINKSVPKREIEREIEREYEERKENKEKISLSQKQFSECYPNRSVALPADIELPLNFSISVLLDKMKQSSFLASCDNLGLAWCIEHYSDIVADKYKQYTSERKSEDTKLKNRKYTTEEFAGLYSKIDEIEL